MLCDKYKEALIEAAASGAALPISLRAHVDVCARCRATLAEEQALFAGVDSNMRRTANAELPESFLPCVRSRLAEEPTSKRSSPAWAAIAASAALIIAAVVVTRDRHSAAVLEARKRSPDSVLPRPPEDAFVKESPNVAFARIRGEQHKSQVSRDGVQTAGPRPIVSVLNQVTTNQLIGGLASGEIRGEVLVTRAHLDEVEDLQIPRIAIATITEGSPEDATSNSSDLPEVRTREILTDADRRTK